MSLVGQPAGYHTLSTTYYICAHWDDDMPSRLQERYVRSFSFRRIYNKELLLDDIVVLDSKITTTYRDLS